jgi:predicted Zn-dependent peptidase
VIVQLTFLVTSLLPFAPLPPSGPGPADSVADHRSAADPFAPDIVLTPPGGPSLYLYTTGTSDVVALRVSVPVRENADEAGAAQIIRALAQDRMEAVASRVGARARASRTPDALIYEVAGPAADMDFLAWVLREGLREPDASRFPQLRRDALSDVEQRLETPEGTLALRLRRALDPSLPPVHGTVTSLERMDASRVSSFWARTHGRDALRVVVVGNLAPEIVLASLTELGLPSSAPGSNPPAATPSGQPVPALELIRHWLAEARTVEGGRDPRALVASRLIAETIRAEPGDYEVGVELWELDRRWVLVTSGAAYPRSVQAMRSRIDGLLRETLGRVSDESVRRHVAGLRAELLDSARTPWGLADVVGHAMDAGEPPDRVQELLDELQRLRGADVERFLEAIASGPSIREEMNP